MGYAAGISIQPLGIQISPSLFSDQDNGVSISPVGLNGNPNLYNGEVVLSGDGSSSSSNSSNNTPVASSSGMGP